jgi:cystathionine beta-lyase
MEKEASLTSYNEMNVMFLHSLLAAYSKEGADWLDGLRQVLSDNLDYAADYIRDHFPGVTAARAQGTYILYLDCTEWCAAHGKTLDQVLKAGWDVGVAWQDGRPFLGKYHIRMTLASPTSRIREAFDRLSRYVFNGEELC